MHKVRLLALFAGVLSLAGLCHAQTATGETLMLTLPRQSQHALVSQRIGITDITINYHRPLANGRQVWGTLVPYDQVWRAGANHRGRNALRDFRICIFHGSKTRQCPAGFCRRTGFEQRAEDSLIKATSPHA